ncbi:hypothetical protein CANCADRAFT_14628, partial [Tortispora caseinolytica NRRL Y-17796]
SIQAPAKAIKALYSYQGQTSDELSFHKGDFFYVTNDSADGRWYDAYNPSTNVHGRVPMELFETLDRTHTSSAGISSNLTANRTSNSTSSVKKDSGFSESSSNNNTRPVSASKFGSLFGIVLYDFVAEQQDELDAQEGDHVIIVAQTNNEWFVAKPIGRLGGPGLLPVSYVSIRDLDTGQEVENLEEAIKKVQLPKVEEWKKHNHEYQSKSITLGHLEMPGSNGHDSVYRATNDAQSRASNSISHGGSNLNDVVTAASVVSYIFDERSRRFLFIIRCQGSRGDVKELYRSYEDFFDVQVRLIHDFPKEAGRSMSKRILPYIPGPVTNVTDKITAARKEVLDQYVQELLALPHYISRQEVVLNLFMPRDGDIDVTNTGGSNSVRNSAVGASRMSRTSKLSYEEGSLFGRTSPKTASIAAPYSKPVAPLAPLKGSDGHATTQEGAGSGSDVIKVKVFYGQEAVALRISRSIKLHELLRKLSEKLSVGNLS